MTNTALREKASPYRISEISISASIPPGVTFAIGRIDDEEEAIVGELHSSAELVEQEEHPGDVVLALDGAMLDESTAEAIAEAAAVPGVMPPSSVSEVLTIEGDGERTTRRSTAARPWPSVGGRDPGLSIHRGERVVHGPRHLVVRRDRSGREQVDTVDGRAPPTERPRAAGHQNPSTSSASTSSIGRVERSPVARSVTSTPPAASDRGDTVRIQGMPEQFGVGELDARRLVAVVPQDLAARPGLGGQGVEPLGDLGHARFLGRADRHEVGGVRRDLGGPDDALLVVMRLHDAGDVAPDADPVRAHDDGVRLAVLAEVRRPERIGVPRAELEDVADLDAVAQDHAACRSSGRDRPPGRW